MRNVCVAQVNVLFVNDVTMDWERFQRSSLAVLTFYSAQFSLKRKVGKAINIVTYFMDDKSKFFSSAKFDLKPILHDFIFSDSNDFYITATVYTISLVYLLRCNVQNYYLCWSVSYTYYARLGVNCTLPSCNVLIALV